MEILLLITALLAPAYAIRFDFLGAPANVLLLWVLVVWLVFIVYLIAKRQVREFIRSKLGINRAVLVFTGLLFLAGLVSLAVARFSMDAIGLFLVWFVQPISMFVIAHYLFKKKPQTREVVMAGLYLLLAVIGIVAIAQFYTLQFLPDIYHGNSVEPKRAIGLFTHPNFLALFVAPVLAFLLPDMGNRISKIKDQGLAWFPVAAWLLGAIALFLSVSRAGWLGLTIALVVFAIFAGNRKIRLGVLGLFLIGTIVVSLNTNLRYRLVLPFVGEKSAVSRLSLWETGTKGIKEDPLLGMGLGGFRENWTRLNTDPNIDSHNLPHNVFLNFWVETGLLGLISFLLIAGFALARGFRNRSNVYAFGFALFLITMSVQGLIDNPYFKNDLAMMFWLLFALGL